jgi:HEAT repeat protein
MDKYQEREISRKYLRDRNLNAAAAAMLGARRQGVAAAGNIIQLLNNSDPEVRRGAIKNLVLVGGQMVVAAIVRRLNDPNLMVRVEACTALGMMRAHAAKSQLYDVLVDRNCEVCCAAAEALANMGDKHGLPYVAKWVCTSDGHQIQALRCFSQITRQRFMLNPRGLKEAIRWIRFHQKDIMKF